MDKLTTLVLLVLLVLLAGGCFGELYDPESDTPGREAAGSSATLPNYSDPAHGKSEYSHDGKLRWAVGAQNVQVVRSAPGKPSLTDGSDTIWRHQQYIAYWGGRFWAMHDGAPTRVFWSTTGVDWSPADSGTAFFGDSGHHRMGFYVASNNRLLASLRVGVAMGKPGNRLVQEILGPGSFGPVYNIKADHAGPYPNKSWPDYKTSTDAGFVAACDELLKNHLYRQQWQEEDNRDPSFYAIGDGSGEEWKAFNWYRLPDNRIVGAWKGIYMTVSKGVDWERGKVPTPQLANSFKAQTRAKTWMERSGDGRFAFVGCANGGDPNRRWPLAVTTSADGITYTKPYLVIAGDIPPERYENAKGDDKNAGPQYVRGITPGNGTPPGSEMWLTYSMNKEDIWVASVPVPINGWLKDDVNDDFQGHAVGRRVNGWNTYSPAWAPVSIAADGTNRVLRLEDRDPVDYSSVTRVFPETGQARLQFQVRPHQTGSGTAPLEIDVVGYNGDRAVAIRFDPDTSTITAYDGGTQRTVASYSPSAWVKLVIRVYGDDRKYTLNINDTVVLDRASCLESSPTVERIVFRTGGFRLRSFDRRPHKDGMWLTDRIPGADDMQPASIFDVDEVALRRTVIAKIDEVSTGRAYKIFNASVGTRVYIDRSYAIASLPAPLAGANMIVTSNDDDYVSTSKHLRFTLSRKADLYLAVSADAAKLPSWATGWTDTGMTVQAHAMFKLYRKSFPEGTVTLGGNDRKSTGASSSYFVFAVGT